MQHRKIDEVAEAVRRVVKKVVPSTKNVARSPFISRDHQAHILARGDD